MNINNRFLNELFINKKVSYYSKYYLSNYNYIWFNSNNFEKFLSGSDLTQKLDYAKKIYFDLQLYDELFMPDFYINNIIGLQQHELKKSNEFYVPQDHIVHSVNLYILGVYLFFNNKFLNTHLIINNHVSPDKDIYLFIKKWRIFAFYHDIGYFIESFNFNQNNVQKIEILKQYKDLNKNIIIEYFCQNICRLIFLSGINHYCTQKFSYNSTDFKDWNNSKQLEEFLNKYVDAIFLKDVNNRQLLDNFSGILRGVNLLIEAFDENGQILGFFELNNFIIKKEFVKEETNRINFENLFNFNLKIYVKNLENEISNNTSYSPLNIFNHVCDDLSDELLSMIEFNDFIGVCLKIVPKLKIVVQNIIDNVNSPTINFEENKKIYKKTLYQVLNNQIKQQIESHFNDEEDQLDSVYIDILNYLKKQSKSKIKEIKSICNMLSGCVTDYVRITEYAEFLINHFKNNSNYNYKNIEFVDFCSENSASNFKINIFNHLDNEEYSFEHRVYNEINNKLELYGLSINDIKNYKPKHSNYDHGIVSACMTYQSAVNCYYLAEYSNKAKLYTLSWYGLNTVTNILDNSFIELCSDSIFSILMHNIYVYNIDNLNGLRYKHNFKEEPFAYFCALCDNLQFWDRAKQLDLSTTYLPESFILGDEIDILMEDDIIVFKCEHNIYNLLNKKFDELNEFLPGARKLFRVN